MYAWVYALVEGRGERKGEESTYQLLLVLVWLIVSGPRYWVNGVACPPSIYV
jgi:hypothetical protein